MSAERNADRLAWFKLFPDEWCGSERVQLLTAAQECAHMRLIMRVARDGSVPECPDKCLSVIGKPGLTREDMVAALDGFVAVDGAPGRLTHPRTLRDREAALAKAEQSSAAGKASALQRKFNDRSTTVQRALNGRPTTVQPRALAQEAEAEAEAEADNTKGYKESLNTPETPPAGVASSATDSAPLDLVLEPPATAKPEADACPHREIARLWNEIAGAHGMPRVMDMTPARETTLRGLWAWFVGSKAEKLDAVRALFERTAASDFLRNGPGRFDWVIAPANRVKVLEGNYDNRTAAKGGRR